jgi:hypothetical protein
MRETYELSGDGKTLTVVSRREPTNGRPAMELKRVYDRYTGTE